MSEAKTSIGQNIVPWKSEASEQAMLAVSRAEEAADSIRSATEWMTQGAEGQREFVRNAAEQFGDASRSFADGNAEKMHTLLTFASSVEGGFQDLQECLAGLVEGVVRTNLRLAQEMFLVESPRAFAELQQRFMREYFDAFEQGAAALIRATSHPVKCLPICE
jgi:hypothetical protein